MVATVAQQDALAAAYAAEVTLAALYTTVPFAVPGDEVTGGTYARQPLSWTGPVNGTVTAVVTFEVPGGTTVVGAGVLDPSGEYRDGGEVTSQLFEDDGSYELTITYTQD